MMSNDESWSRGKRRRLLGLHRVKLATMPRIMLFYMVLLTSISVFAEDVPPMTRHAATNRLTKVDLTNLSDLGSTDAADAAKQVMDQIGSNLQDRIARVFAKAKTSECRALIAEHFGYYINAIGTERSLPFGDVTFTDECEQEKYDFDNLPEGIHLGHIQNLTYQPPRDEAIYIEDPADLRLCFGIMTHETPTATIRLVETLYEPGHVFVIHVDGKEASDETYARLQEFAATRDYVHILENQYRVRVNWGGFSMVNATLQMLRYAFALDRPNQDALTFHKFVHLASTIYPIATNTEIRHRLASYPLDANFLHVVMKPTRPNVGSWHYFVECDDAVHRIYRLPPLTQATAGVEIHTSSQWFTISREFAEYLAEAKPGTFVHEYLEYIQHVVVADEAFFGTVLRHTAFCSTHHNQNFLHLQFDRWENELQNGDERDERKCLMPSPDHCGRSPTTMTKDYVDILELTSDLFARKFLDSVDGEVKDIIDKQLVAEEEALRNANITSRSLLPASVNLTFQGEGVLIVAKETAHDETPLCLGLGETKNKVRLVPCFHDWVPPTLASDWETGAVVVEETLAHNRWDIGPCSSNGDVVRLDSGELEVLPGDLSPTGPRCMLKQRDGIRAGRCIDGESHTIQPGGELRVFPCTHRWYQFFSFGVGGEVVPEGSLHTSIPSHIVNRIREKGKEQEPYLCIGVLGRGTNDEEDWDAETEAEDGMSMSYKTENDDTDENEAEESELEELEEEEFYPLSLWSGEQVVTTQCSNVGAIIEWLFVPFIVEDEGEENHDYSSMNADEGEEQSEL